MDLKIDLLTSNLVLPTKTKPKNIWINMWGIEKLDKRRLKFLSDLFCSNPQASRIMQNISDELIEELEIFRIVHNVQFLEK